MTSPRIAGIILAAGLSSRMGVPKPLLDWCGMPLVTYQVDQLDHAGATEIVVVAGHESDAVRRAVAGGPARVVINPDYRSGRASSIRAAARAIPGRPDALVLLNVDQPRHAETVRRLILAHLQDGNLITVPSHVGRRGHPIVLSAELLPELLNVTDEEQGLRAVVRRHVGGRRDLPFENDEVLLDVNDPAAYAAARAAWRDGD
jgi:molybdenum cofactor cytidylyltransferase